MGIHVLKHAGNANSHTPHDRESAGGLPRRRDTLPHRIPPSFNRRYRNLAKLRSILQQNKPFTFVGAAREDVGDDIRGLLLQTCRNESLSGTCRVVDCAVTPCANGSSAIIESLLGSEFCLQPRGDSFTRRSVFDCMIAGAVPVLFWNRTMYDQYEWYLPEEPESYSVFIDHDDVSAGKKSIKGVLENYSKEVVKKMRERVIEIIPKIVYSDDNSNNGGMKDAFDIAVDGVLRRFNAERDQRRRESDVNVPVN